METNARTAFVTGSNGFVGLNLCEGLLQEGWRVIALHREDSNTTWLDRMGVEKAVGDILDPASLKRSLPENVDAVFHVAGMISIWYRDKPRQTAINVEGTRNMVDAAMASGARRFIFTSSVASFGLHHGPVSESTPSNARELGDNYSINKLDAEKIVMDAQQKGLSSCIMCPAGIMGPNDRSSWARMVYMVRDGKLKGIPGGSMPIAHVREVVRAHIAAVDKGGEGEKYLLAGESTTHVKLFHLIAEQLGVELKAGIVPSPVLKAIGYVQVLQSMVTNRPPDMSPGLATMLCAKLEVESDKAERLLGFVKTPVEECVTDCINWLRAENLL